MNTLVTSISKIAMAFFASLALVFTAVVPAHATSSSSPSTSSVTDFSDTSSSVIMATALDSFGNMYSAGFTNTQILVAKYDSTGARVWLKLFDNGGAQDMAIDQAGNIFISGWFCGPVDLGALVGTMTSVGGCDGFVMKLDSDGNVTDALNWGHVGGYDGSSGVAVDASGNVFLEADVTDFAADGANGIGGVTWTSSIPAGSDISGDVLVKLSNSLYVQYVKPLPSGFNCEHTGHAINVSPLGKILVGGYIDNTTDFGSFGSFTPSGSASDGAWLEFDAQGNMDQVHVYGGNNYQEVTSASYDQAGNIYILGLFMGDTVVAGTPLTVGPGASGFAAKFDASGTNAAWVKSWKSSTSDVYAFNLAVDPAGNVAVTGFYSTDIVTGELPVVTSDSVSNIWQSFVLGINADGTFAWIKSTQSATGAALQFGRPLFTADKLLSGGQASGSEDFGDGVSTTGSNYGFVWGLSVSWAVNTPLSPQQGSSQQASASLALNVPEINAISDSIVDSRTGGDITITGSRMSKVIAVLMGSSQLVFKIVNDSTLRVTLPPHTAGAADLVIKTATGNLSFASAATYSDTVGTHFAAAEFAYRSVAGLKAAIAKLTSVAYVDCDATYGTNTAAARSKALTKARDVCAAAGSAAPDAVLTSTATYVKGSTLSVVVTLTGRAKN